MLAKMGIVEAFGLLALGVVLIFAVAAFANARFAAAREKQARALGLTLDDSGDLSGQIGDFAVEVVTFKTEAKREKDRQHKTRLRVSGGLPTEVHLGRSGLMATIKDRALGSVAGHDIELGSARFDERYVVKGEPLAVFAILDVEARERFTRALDEGWVLQGGAWVFEDFGLMTGDALTARARAGVELAGWLRERAAFDVLPSVIERVRFDPEPEVRLNALAALLGRDGPLEAEVEALLDDLVIDDDPQVRLLVAKGRKNTDALLALAMDPTLKTMTRSEALGLLATLGDERLLTVAMAVLRETDTEAELRRAAVGVARWIGPSAEAMVTSALDDREDLVREAAVSALGAMGSAESVPSLRAVRGSAALERQADEAVRAIQARIGVEAGGLALAVEGGGLAVAESGG